MTPRIEYIRAGDVERFRRNMGYEWHAGFSENGNTYPWLTRAEAMAEARRRGAKAVFKLEPPCRP